MKVVFISFLIILEINDIYLFFSRILKNNHHEDIIQSKLNRNVTWTNLLL